MKLHEISPAAGSTTAPKRLGRGVGSGLGKTSGKGHKGSKARSGGGKAQGFEGGQMKLVRRIPKRGFTNIYAKEYATINLSALEAFEDGAVVDAQALKTRHRQEREGRHQGPGKWRADQEADGQGRQVLQVRCGENRGQWWESRGDLTCWKLSAMPGRWRTSARGSSTR